MMTVTEARRLQREYQYHMERHPSERWEAKLETINLVLSWHEDAGSAPVKGAAEGSRDNFPTIAQAGGNASLSLDHPRREGTPAGGRC